MNKDPNRGIFQIGDILNNTYKIDKVLGRGGTSEVYRAKSEISGRVVAVKALRLEYSRNEDFLALMTREEEMREIRHDAVVRYYDNQRTDVGLVYLVMDYVEGPGLDQIIKSGGMSAEDLMVVARRVTEGLIAAHAKNIVHRDLSPDNIILRHGKPSDAVIIDFGIAKDTNPGAETIVGNEFAGKYAYAAPEQLNGQTDERADIYALGALLLAAFNGKPPNIGNNPMEVIQRKALPLDTSGVPEPLKLLIDKMTQPDRDHRLQTAKAVLSEIDHPTSSVVDAADIDFGDDSGEKTVIAPRAPKPTPVEAVPEKPAKQEKSGGIGAKLSIAAVLVLCVLGAGLYVSGIFGPRSGPVYPVADPYTFVAARPDKGTAQIFGNVPSEETRDAVLALVDDLGGSADLTLAQGEISDNWGADILQILEQVSVLPEWSVLADGNMIKITGTTDNPEEQSQLNAAFAPDALPAGLTGTAAIALRMPILQVGTLTPILKSHADCGPLQLIGPPDLGYPQDSQVMVLGNVASIDTLTALSEEMTAKIGNRDLLLNVDVLNPTLCLISGVLPAAPSGGVGIQFRKGADDSLNQSGVYLVGENPVIDVVIPADMTDGFLFVSALDVSGNVFHLLPNLLMTDNSVANLTAGQDGPVTVRVAYPLAEAADGSKLAFTVDDSTLGKTQIVVIHANDQIFDGLRPTTESAGGFAEALENSSGTVRSLDSSILTTAKN
jgi:tRNA A-37 threonylcarbamoyl transferase component Bud32